MVTLLTLRGEDAVAPWVAAAQWCDHSHFVLQTHSAEVGAWELEPSRPFPFPHKSGALLGTHLKRALVMRNQSDLSGFLQESERLCAREKSPCSLEVFTTSLCHWNANFSGESGSDCYWKETALARSTVVVITEPQKKKTLYSVHLLGFFLNSCSNGNTLKQKDTSSISDDYWGPGGVKSHRCLQVSRLLTCPSGSAASQLQVW